MEFNLLLSGIISMVVGIYIISGKEKREELETYELNSRFRLNYNLLAFGIAALFVGFFCLAAFFYRLLY